MSMCLYSASTRRERRAAFAFALVCTAKSEPGQRGPAHIQSHQDRCVPQEAQEPDAWWQAGGTGTLKKLQRGLPHGYVNASGSAPSLFRAGRHAFDPTGSPDVTAHDIRFIPPEARK